MGKTQGEFMSSLLTAESLAEMASGYPAPCLSLYEPTHRRHPENQQDPIRFRSLVRDLEDVPAAAAARARDAPPTPTV